MKQKATLPIIQGNGITYMSADLTLVHLKILMTIIKELQKPICRMVEDIPNNRLRVENVLPELCHDKEDPMMDSRKVTIRIKDIGLGSQNNRYLITCLGYLREKTCIIPSNPRNPSGSDSVIVAGLISHFRYDQSSQTLDIYILDAVAKKLLLVRDGFSRYDYLQAMSFDNKYTVRMYWIINSWRGRKGFRITMQQLRYLMSAEDKYPRDDNFISKVIKVAYMELKQKGDIWFEYGRDMRDGRDIFSFKVYQRLTDEERKKRRQAKLKYVYNWLLGRWHVSPADCEEMVAKITADNYLGYAEHLRYLTDVTDFRELQNPSAYIKKAMNTYLETLEPIS